MKFLDNSCLKHEFEFCVLASGYCFSFVWTVRLNLTVHRVWNTETTSWCCCCCWWWHIVSNVMGWGMAWVANPSHLCATPHLHFAKAKGGWHSGMGGQGASGAVPQLVVPDSNSYKQQCRQYGLWESCPAHAGRDWGDCELWDEIDTPFWWTASALSPLVCDLFGMRDWPLKNKMPFCVPRSWL